MSSGITKSVIDDPSQQVVDNSQKSSANSNCPKSHLRRQSPKLTKNTRGFAFKNTRGLAPELAGIASGLCAKRALKKGKKFESKPFNGRTAHYLDFSNNPDMKPLDPGTTRVIKSTKKIIKDEVFNIRLGDDESNNCHSLSSPLWIPPNKYLDPNSICDENETSTKIQQLMARCRLIFQGSIDWVEIPSGTLSIYQNQQDYKQSTRAHERRKLTSSITIKTKDSSTFNQGYPGLNDPELENVLKLPQICVCGRSNVGKSSLLNAVIGPRVQALRISKNPGRTQTVQMIVLDKKLAVVDMPGYGYAQTSITQRKAIEARVTEYLQTSLAKRVYILVDIRRGLSNSDIRLADQLEKKRLLYQIVLTKMDKVCSIEAKSRTETSIQDWVAKRMFAFPDILRTSSKDRLGMEQLRMSIYLACGLS